MINKKHDDDDNSHLNHSKINYFYDNENNTYGNNNNSYGTKTSTALTLNFYIVPGNWYGNKDSNNTPEKTQKTWTNLMNYTHIIG